MSVNPPICLELKNINFTYNNQPVLENISFSVKTGEYLGIIGPNGGGKTTLLKIIVRLLKPDSGTVKIFGTIGYVPQRTQTLANFPATVEEIVMSGRTTTIGLFRRFLAQDRLAIKRALEVTDLLEYRTKLISQLSGGQLQRVFIARALAGEPKILILDEPSVGVDIVAQEKFYSFIEHLNINQGLTIIFVSHDIDVVAHEVKSLLCLNRHLICHGTPQEFMKKEHLEKLYGKKLKFILHGH